MTNAVKFNNAPLPEWVKVTGITFSTLPELSHREHSTPRRYGNIDTGVEIGGKSFTLDVLIDINATNIQDRSQELKKWLKGKDWDTTSKFVFEESPNYYYLARAVNSVDINDLFLYGEGTIEFKSPDGIRYKSTETTDDPTTTVNYPGQEEAPVIFTVAIDQDVTNLEIKHIQSNRSIELIGDFTVGQEVIIDCSRKVVTVDGENGMKLLSFASRWIYLEEGNNDFTLSPSISATVTYRERN